MAKLKPESTQPIVMADVILPIILDKPAGSKPIEEGVAPIVPQLSVPIGINTNPIQESPIEIPPVSVPIKSTIPIVKSTPRGTKTFNPIVNTKYQGYIQHQ